MVVTRNQQMQRCFSVMLLQLDTIGLIPIGFLCVLCKKYNLDVLDCNGGWQNLYIGSVSSPFV